MSTDNTDNTNTPDTGTGAPYLNISYDDPIVGGKPLEEFTSEQVTNPELPPGTQNVAQDIQVEQDQLIDPTVTDIPGVTPTATQTATTATVDDSNIPSVTAGTYTASQGTAEQGTVTTQSTVRGQMAELMQDVEAGSAPWANAAIRYANEQMMARGIGASSMAGAAISQAVIEAALPIAQQDAATFGQMNIENLRNRQNTMLSNTAAQNAAKQFNAASENDINKFMADLRDRVLRFNAEQSNAMEQFNVDQENSTQRFYDQMDNENQKFMAENKLLVAESNAQWRRQVATANTAAQNAANAQNVAQRFQISQQAMAELWQEQRDIFDWANQISENERDRAFALTVHAIDRQEFLKDVDTQTRNNLLQGVGNLAVNLVSNIDWSSIF